MPLRDMGRGGGVVGEEDFCEARCGRLGTRAPDFMSRRPFLEVPPRFMEQHAKRPPRKCEESAL